MIQHDNEGCSYNTLRSTSKTTPFYPKQLFFIATQLFFTWERLILSKTKTEKTYLFNKIERFSDQKRQFQPSQPFSAQNTNATFWEQNIMLSETKTALFQAQVCLTNAKKTFPTGKGFLLSKNVSFWLFHQKTTFSLKNNHFYGKRAIFAIKTAIFCHKIHVNGLKWVKRFDIQLCNVGQNM